MMILELKRRIQNWECSGQGDGGFIEENTIGGDYKEKNKENLDNDDDNIDFDNDVDQFGSLKQRPR